MKTDVPLGRRWKAKVVFTFSGPTGTKIVCPALLPPAHRAQMSKSADRISTSLPLPSSPHCAPRTTVTAASIGDQGSVTLISLTYRSWTMQLLLYDLDPSPEAAMWKEMRLIKFQWNGAHTEKYRQKRQLRFGFIARTTTFSEDRPPWCSPRDLSILRRFSQG